MALIAVSIAVRAWAAFGSWFYEDDFYFLTAVAQGENDLAWYFTRHNVHFMPLSFLLVTPVGLLGFAWWAAALEITLLYAAGAFACWWMLTRVFGRNPRIIAPLTFYLFSPLIVPAVTWWAAAINLVAVQAPLFILIGSHVEYLRTRRRRWLVIAAIMLLLVCGVYVKGLVVAGVLGLFTACYAVEGRSPVRRLWVALTRWWPIWAVYGVIGIGTVAAYVTQGSSGAGDERARLGTLFENLIVRNLVPGLLGGPWSWTDLGGFPRQLADASDLAVAFSVLVLLVAATFALYRWHDAWLPLVFLAPPVLATFVAMSSFRTARFPFLALEPRYWADALPYFVLALGVLLMAVPGLPHVRRRRVPGTPAVPVSLMVTAGVAYVVSAAISTVTYVDAWHSDFPARQFVTGAIAQAEESGEPIEVANAPAPGAVMSTFMYPRNTPDQLFSPAPGTVRGTDAGVDLRMLDAWGTPVRARARADLEQDLSDQKCFGGTGYLDLPSATFDYPFWATVTGTFDRATTVYVSAGTTRYELDVPAGRHLLTFRTRGSYDRVMLVVPGEATVCPETVRVGAELEAM